MIPFLVVALAAAAGGGIGWWIASDLRIKSGWQAGASPIERWLDRRRREAFERQLPDALATMSNALRAGFSILQAFDSVVESDIKPVSEEFAILQHQLRLGMSFEDALEAMNARVGSEDLTLVTSAILISRRTGGNVTEIFDKISDTIRGRMKIARKVHTLTAQGRLQGIIVSAMPFFLGAAMTIIKPKLMIPFFLSPIGIVSVLVAVALIALGWMIIRKIINIDI